MAILNVQRITLNGIAPTFQAADAAGDEFANSGQAYLHVRNGGAADITVTINSQQPCNYGFDHDVQVSVPAGGERQIGPFLPGRFNDSNGRVHVSYSAVTGVTVAVVELKW